MALELRQASVSYGDQTVFSNLNLSVAPGEIVFLRGPSGSGKSTVMYLLNGVIPHIKSATWSGNIVLDGEEISDWSVHARTQKIGSVFQNAREQIVFPIVEDELVFPMENLQLSTETMDKRLKDLQTSLRFSTQAQTRHLSGGEKQTLITETTIGMGQHYLLLDEPLANLDHGQAVALMQRLKQLATESGYGILLVEHRSDVLLPYVDRVVDMEETTPSSSMNTITLKDRGTDRVVFDLEDLGYSVDETTILDAVNVILYEGERLRISGDNGAGKTTLLQLLMGFIKPTRGTIRSDFRLLNGGRKRKQQKNAPAMRAAWVLQNPDYQLFMASVAEEIALQGKNTAWNAQLMHIFQLEPLANRHPLSLSEGQKRKVGIAAMLAMEPDLLLLDEPTVGLDDGSLLQLMQALDAYDTHRHEQALSPLTMITVSHDQRVQQFFGQHLLHLEKQ